MVTVKKHCAPGVTPTNEGRGLLSCYVKTTEIHTNTYAKPTSTDAQQKPEGNAAPFPAPSSTYIPHPVYACVNAKLK